MNAVQEVSTGTATDESIALPTGKTCSDCIFFQRTCSWLIKAEPSDKVCDWNPSRFVERAPFVVTNETIH